MNRVYLIYYRHNKDKGNWAGWNVWIPDKKTGYCIDSILEGPIDYTLTDLHKAYELASDNDAMWEDITVKYFDNCIPFILVSNEGVSEE